MSRLRLPFRSSSKKAPPATPTSGEFQGLLRLAEGADPVVEKVRFVAVHGLNGHRERTWTAANDVFWLRDLLPDDVPNARIYSWGYDANTHSSSQTSRRPIIFIAHSLGGIVVKSALIHSNAAQQGALAAHRSIKASTYGILFLGTPHQGGAGVDLGQLLVNIASVFIAADDRLLKHLQLDSEWLQQQLGQYGQISGDFVTKYAFEEYATPTVLGHSIMVVPRASAVVLGAADAEPIAIHADHVNMVRFQSPTNNGYRTILGHLQVMAAKARDEIQKRWRTEDQINAAHSTSRTVSHAYIPFFRNKSFVGRHEQLTTLRQRLFSERDCQKLAIVGLGGVGKTQIALEFAYWVKDHHPDYSIFWAPALSAESFSQACEEMANQLNLVSANKDEDPRNRMKTYLSSVRAGKWLLIIDNADDMDLLYGPSGAGDGILRFLPVSTDGLVLFTTRHMEAAIALAGDDTLELQSMSPQEGIKLLRNSLERDNTVLEDNTATIFLEELSYHPLAITQAIAYLKMTKIAIEDYLNLLHNTEKDLVSLMSREFHDSNRYEGSKNAIATTWLVSFDKIRVENDAAARILSFISRIEPRAIPQSLLPTLESAEEVTHALGILSSYAFVTRRGNSPTYDMHRLVHLATKIWIQMSGRAEETSRQAVQHAIKVFPTDKYTNRGLWREYLPHATRLAQDSQIKEMEDTYRLCRWMSVCLLVDGRTKECVQWSLKECQWRKTHQSEEHPNLLAAQLQLSRAYTMDNQPIKALALAEHVADVQSRNLAEEHPDRLSSQHELATAYLNNNQVAEAIALLQHVVQIRSRTLAEEHPNRLSSQHQLATAYLDNNQVAEAIALLQYIVQVKSRTLAEEHPTRLTSQHQLASAYLDNDQVAEAIALLQNIVEVESRTLAEEHPNRLASRRVLASAYLANSQVTEAIELLQYILEVELRTLAKEHPDHLASQHELARAYYMNGRVAEAVALIEHVVDVGSRMLAEDNPQRLMSQGLLTNILDAQAKHKQDDV